MLFEFRFCIWAVNDGRAGFLGQVKVTRNEIGVEVGLKNIFELSALFFQFFDIGRRLPQGINDHGLPFAFDVVGGFRQTSGIDLFDFHVIWYF